MVNGSDEFRYVSEGRLEGGGRGESLLGRLREPLAPHDRLDLVARIASVAAGLAVLAALPMRLYTGAFGSGAFGLHVTGWGRATSFGTDAGLVMYRGPVHGPAFAAAAVVVVLTAWTLPRCATLGLGVLVGCTVVLFADVANLGDQPGAHVTMGPFLPVVAGAVSLALFARLATRIRQVCDGRGATGPGFSSSS